MGDLSRDFSDAASRAVEYAEALTGYYKDVRGGRTIDLRHAPDELKADPHIVAAVLKRNDGKLPEGYSEDNLIVATSTVVLAQPADYGLTSKSAAARPLSPARV